MKKTIIIVIAAILAAIAALFWFGFVIDAPNPTAKDWVPPVAPAATTAAIQRPPCANQYPDKKAWFGDLHVHTHVSFDATSRGLQTTIDDAYRFAKGETIRLGPYNDQNIGQRQRRLKTPLDFAAVTNHAEWIGEITSCGDPSTPGYESKSCETFRNKRAENNGFAFIELIGLFDRRSDICGPDNRWCRDSLKSAWQHNQQVTEQHYDRSSDCQFTSFHGYEYSNNTGLSKAHRNIIFRNERVIEIPISSTEQPSPLGLWESIDQLCNRSGGDCEAISIPHNPNVSNGRIFSIPWREETLPEQQRQAALRLKLEPIVEMMQIKGESECKASLWNVLGEDEFCDFEKMRGTMANAAKPTQQTTVDCKLREFGSGAIRGAGCQSRLDFARYGLIEGMREAEKIGINPYRFGMIGSTDTHNGTPGDVDETDHQGCCANTDNTVEQRLADKVSFAGRSPAFRNPGGLMGVWAKENSRNALFDAMQNREVFATSGPRIQPRFFAGKTLPKNICQQNFAATGYRHGTAMGGILTGLESSPVFAASVAADPNGNLLERMQLIKIWAEGDQYHQQVVHLAGDTEVTATVDLNNCETRGRGYGQLCASWQDPDFDHTQSAAYYIRALEQPSCRWTWEHCLTLPINERPMTCSDPDLAKVIQERSWTSPIWYDAEK